MSPIVTDVGVGGREQLGYDQYEQDATTAIELATRLNMGYAYVSRDAAVTFQIRPPVAIISI